MPVQSLVSDSMRRTGGFRTLRCRNAWARWRAVALLAGALALPGCSATESVTGLITGGSDETQGRLTGFIGGVTADEPRAALVARDVLATGGNAADAAVALGFALAVTLPSRASLGAGGACLAYRPDAEGPGHGRPEAIMFTPYPSQAAGARADRPAAVPMLARGLFALHARYGEQPFETLLAPAEGLARFGVQTSRALARDLADVAGPLAADPNARAVFAPGGAPLGEGATLTQPDLAATLSQLRVSGVGDFYLGALARRLAEVTPLAGGPITLAALRTALPATAAPLVQPAGSDTVAFLPPPADGGLGAAAAFETLRRDPGAVTAAGTRALAAVSRFRTGGATPEAILADPDLPPPALPPTFPASTSFVTLDRHGGAVACAVTMDNLFGTGRIAPGTGIVLAASPAVVPGPLLAAAIAWNGPMHAFRAAVGGSGQSGAALAVADAVALTLREQAPMPAPVPEPGRANVIACPGYLPGAPASCGWATDPRGAGLAVGSE